MIRKKKRRLKKSVKKFLILIIILILILIIIKISTSHKNNENNIKNNSKIQSDNYITDNIENNSEIVKDYFVNGMNSQDYLNTILKDSKYIEKKGQYNLLEYDFEKQLHYSELEEIYNHLALSEIVKVEIIGTSVDGRNMYSIEIGTGNEVTMFEAGIHAAEVASPLFITKFMIEIVNSYESGDKDIINLLENNRIVILPVANPDGYEAAIFGTKTLNDQNLYLSKNATTNSLKYLKCNANGVDINRNFPSQTSGLYYKKYDLHYTVSLDKSIDISSYYPGETLGSEPETRAIMYWQNKWLDTLKSYIALHSAGRVIYNGKPYLSDEYNNLSNKCASIIGNVTGYLVMSKLDEEAGMGNDGPSTEYLAELLSGFKFSSKTGRLSSDFYAKKEDTMKYKNTCVIVIESLETYTSNLTDIKNEYYNYNLNEAYLKIINR